MEFALFGNSTQPEPSRCQNEFCSNPGHIPATGMIGQAANCSSVQSMVTERNLMGGFPTGRGVTSCPNGFYQRGQFTPLQVTPAATNLNELFFQPNKPGWQPQQGNPRSLVRIGNTYRNGA
jgi:hypothetical protein